MTSFDRKLPGSGCRRPIRQVLGTFELLQGCNSQEVAVTDMQRTSNADSSKSSSREPSSETPASSTSSLDISNDSKEKPTTTSGSQLPKKEINILEDLDKEFNKQRLEIGMEGGQQTGILGSVSPKRDISRIKSLGSEVRAVTKIWAESWNEAIILLCSKSE